jgi:hypothetical protein
MRRNLAAFICLVVTAGWQGVLGLTAAEFEVAWQA